MTEISQGEVWLLTLVFCVLSGIGTGTKASVVRVAIESGAGDSCRLESLGRRRMVPPPPEAVRLIWLIGTSCIQRKAIFFVAKGVVANCTAVAFSTVIEC